MDPETELGGLFGRDDLDESEKRARLLAIVYSELQGIARHQLQGERPSHTLQPTALVNEAYLRLVGLERDWKGRAHFFGAAAQAMRRILIDHARAKQALKRGGAAERVTLAELVGDEGDSKLDVLALNEALDQLESHDERLAEVVKLRFFVGLTIEQTAEALGKSEMTVKRDWNYARAWLVSRMETEES